MFTKVIFTVVIGIHALIHLMGFFKYFIGSKVEGLSEHATFLVPDK